MYATNAPLIQFTHRRSDAPFVRCVWEATSREGGPFASVAYPEWEMVISHVDERVTLTVRGEPVADIVPHARRERWLSGPELRTHLVERSADPALGHELDQLVGQTLDEL